MRYSRSLVAYAFVHEGLQRGDIVSGLMPLFAPLIKKHSGSLFDSRQFSKELNDTYGLSVHPFVVEDWAPRLAEAGLLTIGTSAPEYISYVCGDPYTEDTNVPAAELDEVVDEFIKFATPLFEKVGVRLPDRTRVESMLLSRISDMDFDDIQAKPDTAFRDGDTLALETTAREQPEGDPVEEQMDVACASFILDAQRNAPEVLRRISEISAGALAAEVILAFRVPPKQGQTLDQKHIFLDSPLVLDHLDFSSREEHSFANALVKGIVEQRGVPCIFRHNIDEIIDVLTAAKHRFADHQDSSGAVSVRLMIDSNAAVRLNAFLANPERKIKDAGLQIVDAEALDRPYLKHFSKESETDLISAIRPFKRMDSREVDAASIASMIRYMFATRPRGGIMAHKKLFVTKNTGLVRAGTKYMRKVQALGDEQDPPILSDRYLAGILWLANGGKGTDVPLGKLIANCTAAVRPRRDVITKARALLKGLSPERAQQFSALMEDERCGYYLMRHSLGAAQLITDTVAPQLLEAIRLATAEKVAREKDEAAEIAKRDITERYEQKLTELERTGALTTAELEDERQIRAVEARDATARLTELENANLALQRRIQEIDDANESELQAKLSRWYRQTKIVDWMARVAMFSVLFSIAYVVTQLKLALPLWLELGGPFAISFVCNLLLFSVFPDTILQRWVRLGRRRWFDQKMRTAGLQSRLSDVLIDHQHNTISLARRPALRGDPV